MANVKKKYRLLKNKVQVNTFINDIQEITKYKIKVNLVVENRKYYKAYEIELDLRKLGFTNKMNYKYQLSKELGSIVSRYYYKNSKLNNYISKFNTLIDNNYKFKINSKYDVLNTLLSKYISYLDPSVMIIDGINNHNETVTSGSILNTIAKYFILTIIGIFVIGFIVYKRSKKIRIARRLKKDEKIRFIDELTLLKNRAYLSDFMKTWSNNNIYPQGIIVVDLNHLQEINDKYGVSEGDKQIQSAANALIKTQLDNSELIRSDGNEFVIYTIGYNQKQIINYIHKLNKELKKLPYDYGAEFGFSLILNNLKTIEDALTEAIEDMKSKKINDNKEEKFE